MFVQFGLLAQAAKEDTNSGLDPKNPVQPNDYLGEDGGSAIAHGNSEATKDKTAFSKESETMVKSESILAKVDKSSVKDDKILQKEERKEDKSLVKDDKSLSLVKDDKSLVKDDKSLVKDEKSLVKDEKSLVKSQESKAPSDKTPPLVRQDKGRGGGAVAKTGRIASMFEKASSPCPGAVSFVLQRLLLSSLAAPNFSNKPKTSKAGLSTGSGPTTKSDKGSEAKTKAAPTAVAKTQVPDVLSDDAMRVLTSISSPGC